MVTKEAERFQEGFRAEAMDLLVELDSGLLTLEAEPEDAPTLARVFRAIHTIKGAGSMFGYPHLASFVHKVEEAFDLARQGRLAVTPELIDCALNACDVIRRILEQEVEESVVPGENEVIDALTKLLPEAEEPPPKQEQQLQAPTGSRSAYQVTFKPSRDIFYSGSDPATMLDDLRLLGETHITAHVEQVPLLWNIEADQCYLWWEILLVTRHGAEAVNEVFQFVEDRCDVTVTLLDDQEASVAMLGSIPPEMFEQFVYECEDHLLQMDNDALAIEEDPTSKQNLDSLFRSVHSIKGNTGVLLEYIADPAIKARHPLQLLFRVAHRLESVLDPFREPDAGPLSDTTVQIALVSGDAIRSLLGGLTHCEGAVPVSFKLLEQLGIEMEEATVLPAAGREAAFLNTTSQCIQMIEICLARAESSGLTLPDIEICLRNVKTLSVAAQYKDFAELDEPLTRQWRLLETAIASDGHMAPADRQALTEAFDEVRVTLGYLSLGRRAMEHPKNRPDAPLTEEHEVGRREAPAAAQTIRIDQSKLDRLMMVVGEMLVARGAIPLLVEKMIGGEGERELVNDLKGIGSNISRIADELQSSVMSIRMLPLKTVFQRFPRLVRDLARSLGKEVDFVIEGDGIELDKTILEQIGDPLVHLIRNSVDHGFELPEERLAKGKDASGRLVLRALSVSGGIVIEITDDGRGLNTETLKRKAVEKGSLDPDVADNMSEEVAFQLIFLPGLSTAAKVSDVSGRGVGMDVVNSNVRDLHGTIEIKSRVGEGTTLLIKLPTSLMVSKGILLHAGGQEYILPLASIRDMVKLPHKDAHTYRGQTIAQVRGNMYSIFSLAGMLGLTPADTPDLSVAIVETGTTRYGLIVDKFLTEVEVLVKPLTGGLDRCKQFQGAAIMGDGRVVLVLNALECHNLAGITHS